MLLQIKVTDTKMHNYVLPVGHKHYDGHSTRTIPVAKGILLFANEENSHDSKKFKFNDLIISTPAHDGDKKGGKEIHLVDTSFLCSHNPEYWNKIKPVIVSKTERIEVGDSYLWTYFGYNVIHECRSEEDQKEIYNESGGAYKHSFKILALPEHFSQKHKQAIADGKLKYNNPVYLECFHDKIWGDGTPTSITETFVKLTNNQQITMHRIEDKTYSLHDVNVMLSHAVAHPNITAKEMQERVQATIDWFNEENEYTNANN